jgi:hypothetical protein
MIRRTVLVVAVITGATAAGGWAFGADLSRVTLGLAERAGWSPRGFTPVPHSEGRTDESLLAAPNDSLAGKYCRFPQNGNVNAHVAPLAGTGDAPLGVPLVEGRSKAPQTLQPAICTGEPADTALKPQFKP